MGFMNRARNERTVSSGLAAASRSGRSGAAALDGPNGGHGFPTPSPRRPMSR